MKFFKHAEMSKELYSEHLSPRIYKERFVTFIHLVTEKMLLLI